MNTEIIKKSLHLIILGASIIFLVGSFIFLIISSQTENSINNKELRDEVKEVSDYIKENNIEIKVEDDGAIDIKDLTMKDLLRIDGTVSPKGLIDCEQFTNEKDKNRCVYNHFFDTYSGFLNTKGVVDIDICKDIEGLFGKEGYLTERCYFIYAVNRGTKYLNINACDNIIENTENASFTKEQCIRNVKYSVSGGDNTMGKYFKAVKERGELGDSHLGSQVINKYGNYHEGSIQGVELFKESVKDYLENEKELSNLENK